MSDVKPPGNFWIEMHGGRWDGHRMHVPLVTEQVWFAYEAPAYAVDEPIKGTPLAEQFAYALTPYRCEQHGTTIAQYVKPPIQKKVS